MRDLAPIDACPICGATTETDAAAFEPLERGIRDFEYGVERESTYVRCRTCGLVLQSPRVGAAEIPGLYPDDYQAYKKPSSRLFSRLKDVLVGRDARRVLSMADGPAPAILEVGCGNGAFLSRLQQVAPDATLVGIDIKDLGVAQNPRLRFYEGQIEETEIAEGPFDVIYCSNLIEHVPDPIAFLRRLHSLLKPGAKLVLVTPNHRSLDRYVFGRYWGGYHFPRHTVLFDHKTIVAALEATGFDARSVSGGFAYWAISMSNLLYRDAGRRPRGLAFAAITALMLPFDLAVNLVRPHGSMTVIAARRG